MTIVNTHRYSKVLSEKQASKYKQSLYDAIEQLKKLAAPGNGHVIEEMSISNDIITLNIQCYTSKLKSTTNE